MANDKDFILNNPIEINGSTKKQLGTISSGTIDLSTGNYFTDTLSANTTYTFSNPGDVQTFQLQVTGFSATENWSVTDSVIESSFDVSGQDTAPRAVAFKSDGTKMFIVGTSTDQAREYTLSTAWDVSTASVSGNKAVGANPYGLDFKSDGTKMYVLLENETIQEWNLSTAWTLSGASLNQTLAASVVSPSGGNVFDFKFKPDGTKIYVMGYSDRTLHQLDLSSAWDVSTATYNGVSKTLLYDNRYTTSVAFKSDGTKMFSGTITAPEGIVEFDLSTAWDISSITFAEFKEIYGDSGFNSYGLAFKSDGTKFYSVGPSLNPDRVQQFTSSTVTPATVTWPSSVKWPSGTIPGAPEDGTTDLYTFVTNDGGATYLGFKTADNLS